MWLQKNMEGYCCTPLFNMVLCEAEWSTVKLFIIGRGHGLTAYILLHVLQVWRKSSIHAIGEWDKNCETGKITSEDRKEQASDRKNTILHHTVTASYS